MPDFYSMSYNTLEISNIPFHFEYYSSPSCNPSWQQVASLTHGQNGHLGRNQKWTQNNTQNTIGEDYIVYYYILFGWIEIIMFRWIQYKTDRNRNTYYYMESAFNTYNDSITVQFIWSMQY